VYRPAGLGSSRSCPASFTTRRLAPAPGLPPHMYAAANSPSARTAASRMSPVGCFRLSSTDASRDDRRDLGPVCSGTQVEFESAKL
jgi:hypothetical protein